MLDKILKAANKLARFQPNLVPLLIAGELLQKDKTPQYGRAVIEHQLEEKETRELALTEATHLLKLIENATNRGLLKPGEYLDEHWLHTLAPHMRYAPDPVIIGIVPVLREFTEFLERKLCIWDAKLKNPRLNEDRKERIRQWLLKLSPGCYESVRTLRGIKPYKPLIPYSGKKYAEQLGNPASFTLQDQQRVNHAFRLEGVSEKALRDKDPQEAEKMIERWWKLRYAWLMPEEPKEQRKERSRNLLQKYGVGFKRLEPAPPPSDPSQPWPSHFIASAPPKAFDWSDKSAAVGEGAKTQEEKEKEDELLSKWADLPFFESALEEARQMGAAPGWQVTPLRELEKDEVFKHPELSMPPKKAFDWVEFRLGVHNLDSAAVREGEHQVEDSSITQKEKEDELLSKWEDLKFFETEGDKDAVDGWQAQPPESPMAFEKKALWENLEPPSPPKVRFQPTIEVEHPDIQRVCDLLGELTKHLHAFQGLDKIRDVRPIVAHTSADSEVTLSLSKELSVPATAKEQDIAPDDADRVAVPDTPTPWPASGEQISVCGNELTLRTLASGQVVLRLEAEMGTGAWKMPDRSSVIEVALSGEIVANEPFTDFCSRLQTKYTSVLDAIKSTPIEQPFFQDLLSLGQVRRLENFRIRPGNASDSVPLSLQLAEGAVLKDLAANAPGVVIRLRGSKVHFQEVDLEGTAVDISVTRAAWRNCHMSPMTVIRGTLGHSTFDSLSTIRWDASRADMSLVDIQGDNLQDRLRGIICRKHGLRSDIIDQLKIKALSKIDWENEQRLRDQYLSKDVLINLVRGLSPKISHRHSDGTARYDEPNVVAERQARDSLQIPTSSAQQTLSLLIADPADKEPCQLMLNTLVSQNGRLNRVSSVNVWDEDPVHYHRALFEILDYFFEDIIPLPGALRRERGALLEKRKRPLESDVWTA